MVLIAVCLLAPGITRASSTNPPPPVHVDIAPTADPVSWDALMKEQQTTPGQASADFFFSVTNISPSEVTIERVQTSCGCTVARLPSQPWVLKPHDDGKINVSVDLRGKSGTLFKTITVFFSNSVPKQLTVKVVIPDSPEMQRIRNQQMAMANRQMVFQGDCARCHFEPTRGKTGKELFAAACGICHESDHRATMVPNLHALNHSTDRIFWRQWISGGKVGTLMPAFSNAQGGPLSNEQIESLVEYLWETIPHDPQPIPAKQAAVTGGQPPMK